MLNPEPTLLLVIASIITGFVTLIWSADRFVAGAAAIAHSLGIAPLVIGLTIVSFGTSAPEIMVSLSASMKGAGDLAVGNALGSNVANIGLVLAATMLVARIPVQKHILFHELPILILVTLMAGLFLWDASLSVTEGAILLVSLVPALYFLVKVKSRELSPQEIAEEESAVDGMPRGRAILWFIIGLAVLMLSSEILVWGAKSAAVMAGVSPLIIGLTVIAVGTSLPELAASVVSALRGHHDIALGNIIGSNMFNIMAVMSIAGLFSTSGMDTQVFSRDYMVMLGFTLFLAACIAFSVWTRKHKARLGISAGIALLACYFAYYVLLFQSI
ncbi:cation:H+ antiporter [Alteromonadaceae bacterium Bs31]|nr:cation:H+ antiporter [Alteromonadaceae bacterium Bs31]